MSKQRAIVLSCLIIVLSTVMMGGLLVLSNKTYSLPLDNTDYPSIVTINDIEVLSKIEPSRVDGPNLIGNTFELNIDLLPGESYTFRYDINNASDFNYALGKYIVSCDNNPDVLNYITVDSRFENNDLVKDNTYIPSKTKRTVYVTVKYDNNYNGLQSFRLYFDMNFELR